MAKKTKTLADVQTVTTVNDDQLIPITDASGNVVKVSMANLRAALIGNLQFSSINLIDGSESLMITAGSAATKYAEIPLGKVDIGEQFAISIAGLESLAGDADRYQVVFFIHGTNTFISNAVYLTATNKTGVLTITKQELSKASILIYAGPGTNQCAGNTVRFDNVMFVRGNMPCLTWAPSINDQKQNAIDGVKVGGVNLQINSNFSNDITTKGWEGYQNDYILSMSGNRLIIEANTIGEVGNNARAAGYTYEVLSGKIAISFDVWSRDYENANVSIRVFATPASTNVTRPITNVKSRVYAVIDAGNTTFSTWAFAFDKVGEFYVENVMVEKATVSSQWRLAPQEDNQ